MHTRMMRLYRECVKVGTCVRVFVQVIKVISTVIKQVQALATS